MRRIKLTLVYDGTVFHGWQVQPGRATIQGTLESVFSEIEGASVHVEGSGRTDAGVHALGQVAAVSLGNAIPLANLRKAVNRLLPADIRLIRAEETSGTFHPRYDAVAKTYEYRIFRGEICSPFERRYVKHHPYPLDEGKMEALAPVFEGEYDFRAFAASDEKYPPGEPLVRRVFESRLRREEGRLIYRVRGNGFLKHMVRNLVGTLLEAGKGNLGQEEAHNLLHPGRGSDRRCGPTAPAQGLFLISVEY